MQATSAYENKSYEINRTLVLGMRAIGKGRSATAKLSAYLGLPAPTHQRHWRRHTKELSEKVSECVDVKLDEAVLKLKRQIIQDSSVRLDDNDQLRETVVDCAVSVDGSWLTRGFYSRHGFVSVVSLDTGECLDRIYMCSSCRECKRWEGKPKTSAEYMEFFEDHFPDCPVNHEGSAQTMESEGAEQLFCRSIERHNLRYTRYIGDGDSKSYLQVKNAEPYGADVTITKEECVGHVQKRMGTRLRTLVNRKKGVKLSDGKSIHGKGRLTQKRIDSFQVFYGHAIRSNKGNVEAMASEAKAILYHYASTTENPQHEFCPQGVTSWCKWKRDEATGDTTYKPAKYPLPQAVVDEVKSIFDELCDPILLKACVNCHTQNQNESLHHIIWSLVPKEEYHSPLEVRLGIDLAVLFFNEGNTATVKSVFQNTSSTLSDEAFYRFVEMDRRRIYKVAKSCSPRSKQRRKMRRQERLAQLDAFEKDEGVAYQSGAFHSGIANEGKVRCCKQCSKPMKGHPRGRCP